MGKHLKRLGFNDGVQGTHIRRTIMFAELQALLNTLPTDAKFEDYRKAIIEKNVLGKRTENNRKYSFRFLKELYALDSNIPLFRFLRFIWFSDKEGRPLLSMLCAIARDPILRLSIPTVLKSDVGVIVDKRNFEDALRPIIGARFSEITLTSIIRRISSSWTQAGFLSGRIQKVRIHPVATSGCVAFALFLGYLEGLRAQRLFTTRWAQLLEKSTDKISDMVKDAACRGWLDYLSAGSIVEIRFPNILTSEEENWTIDQT